jgi:hypothetical protein
VTEKIKIGGGQAMVQADNSIAIYIDNQVVDLIPSEVVENEGGPNYSKLNEFTISTKNINNLIKQCIRYMVEKQNSSQALKDYWFYNNKIKVNLKKSELYNDVMKNWKLKAIAPYGLNFRENKAGQQEIQKDPTAEVSIFDTHCFIFYLVKYCEIVGIEAIIAAQEHISYT